MILTCAHFDQLVEHARSTAPSECCGFLRLDGDQVFDLHQGENCRRSGVTYELDFTSLAMADTFSRRGEHIALYHSHLRTPAVPSPNDVRLAFYPWRYVIVSIADVPEVRAWWIDEGLVTEDPVQIID